LCFAEKYLPCSLTRKRPQLSIFSDRTVAARRAQNSFLGRIALTASFLFRVVFYFYMRFVSVACGLKLEMSHVTGLSRLRYQGQTAVQFAVGLQVGLLSPV
jgi:hypothetical protein